MTGIYDTIGGLAGGMDPDSSGIFNQSYFLPNQPQWQDWSERQGWHSELASEGNWYDEYL